MYATELIFNINNQHEPERTESIVQWYLASLYKNGQILGGGYPVISKGKNILSYILIPDFDSLDAKYSNKYVSEDYNKLINLNIKITQNIIGKEIDSSDICNCNNCKNYILCTNFLTIESPLHCGNCFGIIPLYKIPKTYDDGYSDIKRWESDYRSCDELQINCSIGEKFGMKQLSTINSNLSIEGMNVCKNIMNLTGKNVYYYLDHYVNNPIMKKEINRKCPLCGGDWILKKRLFGRFDFKCDKCLLLSNIQDKLIGTYCT
jgi:predicted  nucleic acid-binding Zn ribbon protein